MRQHFVGRIRAVVLLPLLLVAGVLVGCGGDETGTASGTLVPGASSPGASGASTSPAAACPSENTRSFAKTRFVADLGGAAFLTKRYIYDPYQAGKFQQGASGRTTAIVKAGLAAAASVKLLSNARENAQANPTLCRTVAAPMGAAIAALSGVTAALASGDLGVLGTLGPALDSLRGLAADAGVEVPEREVGLNGS
jgi:hypothetical protein